MENLDLPPPPLSPQIKDGKMARFCLRAASSLIWGGWEFAVPFYFVQDCRCPRHIQSVFKLILDILIDIYVMINVT